MITLNPGDRVVVEYETGRQSGVLKSIISDVIPPICVIEHEDYYAKVPANMVKPEPTSKPSTEPTEDESTVTKERFRTVATKMIIDEYGADFDTGLMVAQFVAKLNRALFES